ILRYMNYILITLVRLIILEIYILVRVAFLTLLEHKILEYIQECKRSNKVGLGDLLQPFRDAIKLFSKEIFIVYDSNYYIYYKLLYIYICISQTLSYEINIIMIFLILIILRERYSFIDFLKWQVYVWCGVIIFLLNNSWRIIAELNRRPIDFVYLVVGIFTDLVLLKIGGYGLIELYYKVRVKYNYLIFRIGIIGRIIMVRILCLVQNLILCRLMIIFKAGVIRRYVIIISHGLCSSGILYIVNLYYERSGRRLLFLNKSLVSNLPAVIIWLLLFCIINFSFPLSLNFIGEIIMLIRILNWDVYILIYLMLICFFRAAYSLYLYSYVYHRTNIYYENKIYNFNLKEYIILFNAFFFLLLIYLLNLIIFM
ncbi:NU4M oxidoreductase, partial [Acromyrmex insinuator]